MDNQIKRTVGSGGNQYDVIVAFNGMAVEDIQKDAMSFYVWKIQRQIREASDDQKAIYKKNGITLHASEVGKPVVDTGELVEKMTDAQALEAFELLKSKLGE